MPQSQSQTDILRDILLTTVLRNAKCKTNVNSIKDLHKDEKALAIWRDKKVVRRQIYREWPRDPKGGNILPENSCFGKMTSSGAQFWGATLWDFYFVHRIPDVPELMSVSTGSKLAKWMIEHKETEHAASELSWAKKESDPHEITPYPIAEVIEAQEMSIRMGLCGKSMPHDTRIKVDGQEIAKEGPSSVEDQQSDNAANVSAMANSGVFHRDAYPAPWPLVPFSYDAPKIEHRIPLYRLPKKLVVHDPWDVLSMSKDPEDFGDGLCEWCSTEDITYVYNLSLSASGKTRVKNEVEACEKKKEQCRLKIKKTENGDVIPDGYDGFMIPPSAYTSSCKAEPPVFVIYPIAPDPDPVDLAHLYISPDEIFGEGHHSLVLQAEWEVPRSMLVPDVLCYECILDDVRKTLIELDGVDGSRKPECWKKKTGLYEVVDRDEQGIFLDLHWKSPNSDVIGSYIHSPNAEKLQYSGPVRVIKTNVQWQNGERGPYCSHILNRMHADGQGPHPSTARVRVVAKLSKGDEHLDNEAKNYEEFPQHLFEHWNGYTVVGPTMRNPVPVGAVVPQYYGYYELDEASEKSFKSPILLMEECGVQIEVENLREDDRIECASLFYRLHEAGYVHESVFPRNMLYQYGPLDRPRYQRGTGEFTEDGRKYAFRLIDFGRSSKYDEPMECTLEESAVGMMLRHTWYRG